jgi:hypothetical protein
MLILEIAAGVALAPVLMWIGWSLLCGIGPFIDWFLGYR